ncbi:MAG: hypothetical protein ACTHU0_09195 [Kofleriaceae bacterium]
MFALALVLSVAGLLIGPALGAWARGRTGALAAFDAATLALVPGLILLRLMPHLVEDAGVLAIIGFAFGYLALQLFDTHGHGRATQVGVAVVLPTLVTHAFFDGAALGLSLGSDAVGPGAGMIVLAVLLHRVPEGLFLGALMEDAGPRRTRWAIAAISVATIAGGLSGRQLLQHAHDELVHAIIAVGLGAMLRLVVHRHDEVATTPAARRIGGLTFVACLAAVIAIPGPQRLFEAAQPGELSVVESLVPLFLETALLVVGVLAVAELVAWRLRRRSAIDEQWAASTLLSLALLGPCFAALRGLSAAAGRALGRRSTPAVASPAPVRARQVLPAYCVGVVLAIATEAALPAGSLRGLDAAVLPVVAMLGGFVRIGGAGVPVIGAILLHKGAAIATVSAYVLASALPLALATRSPVRRLAGVALACAVALAASPLVALCEVPSLHQLGAHVHPVVEWASAGILVAWIAVDLARTGPRDWFRPDRLVAPIRPAA